MPYPPPVPPATRTNATVMATNHPADHNLLSAALTEVLNHMATLEGSLYPIGTISMTGANIAPGNHLLCQGQAVLRLEYPEVFALYGEKYGVGNGSTTFNLPSFQGRAPMGFWAGGVWATALGQFLGNADSTLPSHQHLGPDHLHGVSIMTGDENANHFHYPDSGGQFLMNGAGSGGDAFVKTDTVGPHSYALGMPAGRTNTHQHPVNGATQAADRSLATDFRGGSPTNTNISPGLVVNFMMRMH